MTKKLEKKEKLSKILSHKDERIKFLLMNSKVIFNYLEQTSGKIYSNDNYLCPPFEFKSVNICKRLKEMTSILEDMEKGYEFF